MSEDYAVDEKNEEQGITFVGAGSLNPGDYCMLDNKPCKVVSISKSKPGKHGAAKAHIVGLDLFTGKKIEENHATTSTIQAPKVTRSEYELTDVDETNGQLTLMDADGNLKEDLNIPPKDSDVGKAIAEKWQDGNGPTLIVVVLSALGQDTVCQVREGK